MQMFPVAPDSLHPAPRFTRFQGSLATEVIAGTAGMGIETGDSRGLGLHHANSQHQRRMLLNISEITSVKRMEVTQHSAISLLSYRY
jgi:hypothetical protein